MTILPDRGNNTCYLAVREGEYEISILVFFSCLIFDYGDQFEYTDW